MDTRIHLEEKVYATVTSEGTLIIENVTEGPLGQDRIRCIGLSPTGAQALLDLLANGGAVEHRVQADGFTAVPNSNLEVNQTVSAKAAVVRRRR